jgi:glycosyltransferase involved in cell wall biosynthesis
MDTRPIIAVPAYQPSRAFVELVRALLSHPEQIVIVVDDGSTGEHAILFEEFVGLSRVHVLRHATNLGKGQALKTAFNYFLVTFPDSHVGIVTADADGQHLATDIQRVVNALLEHPTELVLGTRRFEGNVPWRSAVGNRLTRAIFHLLVGRRLEDTQTGLRGIPRGLLRTLLRISSARYEFEFEALVKAVKQHINILEVTIATVYEDYNRSSHFAPIRDSLRIYFVFLRFASLSLATAGIDFLIFSVSFGASSNILLSTAAARTVAGAFNFYFARRIVFKSARDPLIDLARYVVLVVWLMTMSYTLLTALVIFAGLNVYISKAVAETTLFVANFAIQRLLVFNRSRTLQAPGDRTNWDRYYTVPARQAQITRRITTALLIRLFRHYGPPQVGSICELGGANSCFYGPLRRAFPSVQYSVIDNNDTGLRLLRARSRADELLNIHKHDVLTMPDSIASADIVFSVGLIEHFAPADTAEVIAKHFSSAAPAGLVVITFPTPTWLYRATRAIVERLGVWRFPDERPLSFTEVISEVAKHGTVVHSLTNWAIVLTQGIVVARR